MYAHMNKTCSSKKTIILMRCNPFNTTLMVLYYNFEYKKTPTAIFRTLDYTRIVLLYYCLYNAIYTGTDLSVSNNYTHPDELVLCSYF